MFFILLKSPYKHLSGKYLNVAIEAKLSVELVDHSEGERGKCLFQIFHWFNWLDLIYRPHKHIGGLIHCLI